jgi:hypothetical protein
MLTSAHGKRHAEGDTASSAIADAQISDAAPPHASWPSDVRKRWPLAQQRATSKLQTVSPNRDADQLVRVAQKAATASQRVVWLQRAASAWTKPMEPVAACRQGCAHCCHIAVTISSVEAELIGKHAGIKPQRPAKAVRLQSHRDLQSAQEAVKGLGPLPAPAPCPFLNDNACSIYAVRPMACRLLLNLDDDELLCRLVPGKDIPVPYANSKQLQTLYLLAQVATPLADIRDFFPKHRS